MESKTHQSRVINVLTATAAELADLLEKGQTRSVDLVDWYLSQVEKHNLNGTKLRAMISTASKESLMQIAERLDKERASGKIRSVMHGIPVIVKDNICTSADLGLATTCGSLGLEGSMAKENALIVERMLEAGMIVIGKSNLSEMAGAKGYSCTAGWSAIGGQTQSAYVIGGVAAGDSWLGHSTPGGSSSGSAVAVSAGFAPVAIGTETDGSIQVPADRAALYAIKATVGVLPTEGLMPFSSFSDSLGPMAKSAKDIANLLTIMDNGTDYTQFLSAKWEGLRIGFLDPEAWRPGEGASAEISEAATIISKAGGLVKKWVSLRRFSSEDDKLFSEIGWHDYGPNFTNFTNNFKNPNVHSMEELVRFNEAHAARALPSSQPGQEQLIDAIRHVVTDEKYESNRKTVRYNNQALGIDKTLSENEIDVIMGTPTGRLGTVAAAAGYPCGNLPLGYAKSNGRPFGLVVIAPANREDLILRAMSAWEATIPARKPPPQLVHWDDISSTAHM